MPTSKEAPYKKRQREAREGLRPHTYWPSPAAGPMSWQAIANANAARNAAKTKAQREAEPEPEPEPEPEQDAAP